MKRLLLVFTCALLLAGCGSSVKLDDVAVEDRSATPVAAAGLPSAGTPAATSGAGAGPLASQGVAPVDLTKSGADAAIAQGPRIVYFDYDSFIIKPEFQTLIEAQARYLRADPKRKAVIEGHTDETGGREYNLALGQKRAEAVRRAMSALGVPDRQMEAVSFGEERPRASGTDEASYAENRRADLAYQ